ncbi:MAG: hypothetical protein L3J22_08800 [Xanthomonadales bacterium]|nr:hypothetical protein [Xanthomonadales bacterium]
MSKCNKLLAVIGLATCALLLITTTSYASLDEAIEQFNNGELETATTLFNNANANLHETAIANSFLGRIAFQDEDYKQAEKLIVKAHKSAPTSAKVQSNYGILMAAIAQQASIFKKLGYAKKSLSGFKQASELEPDNLNYRQNLMGYYLGAPGIAGGDNDLALEQAKAIGTLDAKRGLQARFSVYQATDDTAAIESLLASLTETQNRDPDILLSVGLYFQSTKDYGKAIEQFELSIAHASDEETYQRSKYSALYQIGRTSVVSENNIENGMAALREYIQTAPTLDGLPSKNWAEFRLANLIELNGQQTEAKKIYTALEKNVTDRNLKKAIQAAI